MHVMDGTSARCESLRLHKFNHIVDKMLVCSVHLACTQKRGSNLFIFNIGLKIFPESTSPLVAETNPARRASGVGERGTELVGSE